MVVFELTTFGEFYRGAASVPSALRAYTETFVSLCKQFIIVFKEMWFLLLFFFCKKKRGSECF